nr:hypothetical protein [Tanacetum cinerariifolium]
MRDQEYASWDLNIVTWVCWGECVEGFWYAVEEQTAKIDEGQAGSDPGKTFESRPPPDDDKMAEDQAGSDPGKSHVDLAGSNPEPMHDDFLATIYPSVHESLKFLADEQNVDVKVVSIVTFPIHQASTSVPPLSTPIIDLSPLKSAASPLPEPFTTATTETTTTTLLLPLPPPPQQQSTTNSELAARVTVLEKKFANFEQKSQTLDNTTQNLRSRVFTLELRDLPYKINQTSSYKSLPEHVALYEALEASMKQANRDEFLAGKDMTYKRCRDDQDPHPLSPDSDLSKKKRHDSDASRSKQPLAPSSLAWKAFKDVPIPDDVNIIDSEDIDNIHLPKIKTRPDWLKPLPEEDRPETLEPDWIIPPTDLLEAENNRADALAKIGKKKLSKSDLEGLVFKVVTSDGLGRESVLGCSTLEHSFSCDTARRDALLISKLKAANYPDFRLEELVPSLWIESERDYNISAAYVRSYMRILSVISIKTFERYGYAFLREIVIRGADYNEYKISKADFKNLHPNDFKDLHLLHFQGKLNYLPRSDKTNLNLNELRRDASNFVFKEDYNIISNPRAIIYKDRNNLKKMLRENEVHKFSDGTLTRVLHKLDHMVKDFRLYQYNLGMEYRI